MKSGPAESAATYIPGVCNLGGAEVRMRTMAAWGCLGLTVISWGFCFYAVVPAGWRFLVALPATGALLCWLQSRYHFCVHYGLLGVFNVGTGVGQTDTVEQAEYRRLDQQKALKIIAMACAGGIAVGVLAYLCS
ncbi:MAG: hypothetical protein ACAI35_15420 [Candidatus Methylacidiphilales bacterium]|nr:hypothetical protein [Candidatus Methylacidiphilales bacterium]